ncbi:FAD-binding oxidoreductase [Serratia sp. JUb9]|uniref:FAD-dependent oxidoreductase n=1 Tax=Serratia sp. JUb9 TaxID=2724469 RepID=UPI00164E116B|nr:FAD-binding oxidoreductase [Serratia sp. JUb9]QNK33237.1 FAD-binding oxidoreductase [Serratia sp. JUb9]
MRPNIAIIGAGITGVMTALACARKGASVELYDAAAIPNATNLSWAHGRLWKHVHENNAALQSLAAHSLTFWRQFIGTGHKTFGCQTQSIRVVDDADCRRLAQLYDTLSIGYDIQDPVLSVQNSLLRLPKANRRIFVGHDAILLDAQKVYAHLCQALANTDTIVLKPHTRVELNTIREGRHFSVNGERKSYTAVICTASRPLIRHISRSGSVPVPQYQVHLDVHLNDARAYLLKPVLTMGDEHRSWCVPSPERRVLKVSASRFSYPMPPDSNGLQACKQYLLDRLRVKYDQVDVAVSPYFELPTEKRQNTAYWGRHDITGCIAVEACDASIFKIAPALSEQISQYVIHGVNE